MKPARYVFAVLGLLGIGTTAWAEPIVSLPTSNEAVARAQQCFGRGDYSAAASIYEKLLVDAPDSILALSNLGVVRFRLDQLEGAAEVLERAAKLVPDDVFVRSTLGIVYYRQARYKEAEKILCKAAELAPQNASVHRYLVFVYSRQGRADRVRDEWGKIYGIELAPRAFGQ